MPCTFCDAPLPAGARYCPQCGVSVGPGEVDGDPIFPTATEKPAPVYADDDDPAYSYHRPAVSTSTTAVLSLACGVAAWSVLPLIGAILAVITGHRARREIELSRGTLEGGNLATIGLVLGYVQLIPVIFALVLGLFVFALGIIGAALHGGLF